MKPTIFSRTILLAGALLFSILSSYGQNDPSDKVVGIWTKSAGEGSAKIIMTSDQTYEVRFTGGEEADVWGSFEISGKRITFTDKGGQYSSDSSGVYEFKAGDATLTFTIVDDPVDGRSRLVEGTWSKATDKE